MSKKSKYAIKALVSLARQHEAGGHLPISGIAEAERIPRKFLEAILLELRNKGILGSKMGVSGGYYLVKDPAQIMLSDVMRITDGPIALLPCVSLNFYETCEECTSENVCGLRDVAIDVRDASLHILNNTSIGNILEREQKLKKSGKRRK